MPARIGLDDASVCGVNGPVVFRILWNGGLDRAFIRLNRMRIWLGRSEEHTSELQSQ